MAALRSRPLKIVYGISYQIMTKYDYAEVDVLSKVYFRDETMCASIGMTNSGSEVLLRNMKRCAEHGNMSIVARDRAANNKMVGFHFTSLNVKDGENAELLPYEGRENERMNKVVTLCRGGIDLYDYFGEDRFMGLQTSTVAPEYRGHGVMKNMVHAAMEMARSRGVRCFTAEPSGEASFRASVSMGLKTVSEIFYKDFKIDGEVVFANTGKNDRYRLMVLKME